MERNRVVLSLHVRVLFVINFVLVFKQIICYSNVIKFVDFPGKHWRNQRGIKPSTNARDRPVPQTLSACMGRLCVRATGGPGLSVSVMMDDHILTLHDTTNYGERWICTFTRTMFVFSQHVTCTCKLSRM